MLDLEKVYDKVWHTGLLYNYLENGKVKHEYSDPIKQKVGIPQGGALSSTFS